LWAIVVASSWEGVRRLGFVVEIFTGVHGDEARSEDHGEKAGGDHEFVHG